MTRLCKIEGFKGFIGGKDNDNIFEEGVVYNVTKILGQIILTPIGKSREFLKNGTKISMVSLNENIVDGSYLTTLNDK